MQDDDKRLGGQDAATVQAGNRRWWTRHTMSYDWHDKVARERFSRAWFDEIDRRFIDGARLFAHDRAPFDRVIPFAALKDKSVLEIGCGMGLHTELMAGAGARVTAIDISDTSVAATRARALLKGFSCDVRQADATVLDAPTASFDFVWSWGVIHHSAHTGRIVREIHRVLKPGGETRIMVYNLAGAAAYVTLMRRYLAGFWRGRSLDELLWADTDGFTARHYTPDLFADLLDTFFPQTRIDIFGQEADAIPLPRQLRRIVRPLLADETVRRLANRRGSFLFATAVKEES